MRCAVICPKGYESSTMRAEPLSELGWDVLYYGQPVRQKYEVIWAVKPTRWDHSIRRMADRLILDPLDFWMAGKSSRIDPFNAWGATLKQFQYDTIVATSPAAARTMRDALPENFDVQCVRHHGDPVVTPQWYDPHGHVAYAGRPEFIRSGRARIDAACARLGRKFVSSRDNSALRGAALSLCLRLPPYHKCPVCRYLKPQVKQENAAMAGTAMLYSGLPCETSVRAGHPVWTDTVDPAEVIDRAIQSSPPGVPFTLEDYLQAARNVVCSPGGKYSKPYVMKTILCRVPSYRCRTLVETGIWNGDFTKLAAEMFDSVHAVELSEDLYEKARLSLNMDNVTLYHGDSRSVLPWLVDKLDEPCVWHLDSHHVPGAPETAGTHDHPLTQELEILAGRSHSDIIAIDDVHAFGRDGEWENISCGSILSCLDHVKHSEVVGDMFAVWRSPAPHPGKRPAVEPDSRGLTFRPPYEILPTEEHNGA